jgi:hypothetical protein
MGSKRHKLGRVQEAVLVSLRRHKRWSRGCGWVWDNQRHTQKVLDSLVRTGHATVTDGVYRAVGGVE